MRFPDGIDSIMQLRLQYHSLHVRLILENMKTKFCFGFIKSYFFLLEHFTSASISYKTE